MDKPIAAFGSGGSPVQHADLQQQEAAPPDRPPSPRPPAERKEGGSPAITARSVSAGSKQAGEQLGEILAMDDTARRDKLLLVLLARHAKSLTPAAVRAIRVVWLDELAEQGGADSKRKTTAAITGTTTRLQALYAALGSMLARVTSADERRRCTADELSALKGCDALPAQAFQALSTQLDSMARDS